MRLIQSILVGSIIIIIEGFVVAKLWNWFIAIAIETEPINLGAGVGIAIILEFATDRLCKKELTGDTEERVIELVLAPLFYLFLGWIASFLI